MDMSGLYYCLENEKEFASEFATRQDADSWWHHLKIRELQRCSSLFLWSLTGSNPLKCNSWMLAVKPRVKPSKPYEYYS